MSQSVFKKSINIDFKKSFFVLFLFLPFSSIIYSQCVVKDKYSENNIAFVEIYSDKGDLIGVTDIDGVISINLINKIKSSNSKQITFVNSFFESKNFEINSFKSECVLKMDPIVNELKEVVISPKKDQNKFLVLRTYVRSLQINNGKIHYFMDGIVEYYISLKTKKVKINFISNRSFENKSIKQLKEKGLKIYFQIVGAPMLNEFLNYKNLIEKYNFQKINQETKIMSKDVNSLKGNYFLSKTGSNLSLGFISNDKPKVMKGLGVENILENYNINSFYGTSNFEQIGFNTILYFKETRNYKIKAKKDLEYQKIDAIHEVFVLDYRYSKEIDAKNLDNNYSFINSSSYSDNYWEKVNNTFFQPLPKSIEQFMKDNLSEL